IFCFDEQPLDPALPARIDRELAAFGPDGAGRHSAPGLTLGHRALHGPPETPFERQPFESPRGHVMTWDGRLDNRDDLLLQLGQDLPLDSTDVAIAMGVYEGWGMAGNRRLLGDWSLAIWNHEEQSLSLASDYAGNRGLYYAVDQRRVHWSTSLG